MVSLIQSTYWEFGSGLVPPKLGFALQNRGALFALDTSHFNVYEPGKRPFHTIIPAFITKKGKPYISFGVMGGDMQPQGQLQVLVNIIDHGMDVQQAGDAASPGAEDVADVVVRVPDDRVEVRLVLAEHRTTASVRVRIGARIRVNDEVVVRDQLHPDGHLSLVDARDAVQRRHDRGQG